MLKDLIEKLKECKSKKDVNKFYENNKKELDELNLSKIFGGTTAEELAEEIEKNKREREEDKKNFEIFLEILKELDKKLENSKN